MGQRKINPWSKGQHLRSWRRQWQWLRVGPASLTQFMYRLYPAGMKKLPDGLWEYIIIQSLQVVLEKQFPNLAKI